MLILFAHPALDRSRVNRGLVDAVRGLPGITFHDLYEHYPEFDVDPGREQELLVAHDAIVLQHPFYWYSTPALVKQWEDLVLEHGWAYGAGGTHLHGKKLLSAVTTGGPASAYQEGAASGYTMRELLAPLAQTASFCGMEYLSPFVVHATHRAQPADIERAGNDYRRAIEALRDDRLDFDALRRQTYLNSDLDAVIRKGDD